MWPPKEGKVTTKNASGNALIAVAVDKDKGSQFALKWTIDNLLQKGQVIILIHVLNKPISSSFVLNGSATNGAVNGHKQQLEKQTKELFLTFHCYCTRKDVQCLDIVLEGTDVVKALIEYVSNTAIKYLVLGASSKSGFIRKFKTSDVPSHVSKGAPDFCTVYIISKGKISSVRNASHPTPFLSPLHEQIQKIKNNASAVDAQPKHSISSREAEKSSRRLHKLHDDYDMVKLVSSRERDLNGRIFGDPFESDSDISFVSSGRPSTDRMSSAIYESMDTGRTQRLSTSSNNSFGSVRCGTKASDLSFSAEFSSSSFESGRSSVSSQNMDDVEAEMRRLKVELQRTMDLYSTACKEALTAKQKATELHRWRMEEEQRLKEACLAGEAALEVAEQEKAKSRATVEAAEASQRIADREAQRRVNSEMMALKELEERQSMFAFNYNDLRCRRYTIDEIEKATNFFAASHKIGEGGYGPVFKCYLDHTPVAVKVLRPDAAQGRSQFQQEVDVLSCMRHPNMVLLLGACPEYGCLVYEYMANGSLEDRLFRRGNTPALSWQQRFRIAAEIAMGLHFLHQTKPEPLVHRDLKPANILLDQNYVTKISDVGLARIVPSTMADGVTQYRMTSAAGTFCYIDPEYQQTGMLGVKSDIYSLGIMLLQLITAKPAMGIAYVVDQSIENGTFVAILDPAVPDWPVEEALAFAKLSLQCAELRRKDRPDLGKVVLPELNRLRYLAQENMSIFSCGVSPSQSHSYISTASSTQEVLSDPHVHSGSSLRSHSSTSSHSQTEKL